MDPDLIVGHYAYRDKTFIPDEGMVLIEEKMKKMKLLFDGGSGTPIFYFDPEMKFYWQRKDYQEGGYRTELQRVSREYIEKNFPSVNPDRLLDMKRK